MKRMLTSKVLIVGLQGLGCEVAKNVILSGVGSVTLYDPNPVQISDLSSNFYLAETSVGKPRAESCFGQLLQLNDSVKVSVLNVPSLTEDVLSQFTVVVLTNNNDIDEIIRINNFNRKQSPPIKTIVSDTRGLFGSVFVDNGVGFEVFDNNGEEPVTGLISNISQDINGIITVHEDKKNHGLEDGDLVKFIEIRGMSELNFVPSNPVAYKVKVISPLSFSIDVDTTNYSGYQGPSGQYVQVKKKDIIDFKSFEESLKEPQTIISDFGKMDRPPQLHCFYQALLKFQKEEKRLPLPYDETDAKKMIEIAKEYAKTLKDPVEISEGLIDKLSRGARGDTSPFAAFLGGFVGHEVLKASSGKFTPLTQYLYFDALECLPSNYEKMDKSDFQPQNSRYDGQIVIFGKQFQNVLQNQRVFLVGSGALGCEYLKSFAMMGVGTGPNGQVTVTDMDTIERSNLSRQFLFRNKDIGELKATTASRAAQVMNPALKVKTLQTAVGTDTENVFNDEFWNGIDVVVNALDNIKARQYVDRRCVFYGKPLLESGTLATKGNTQVIKPNLTECYSDSQDPPEKSIPMCTLKNFPNAIEHTLQWGRDAFEDFFKVQPENLSKYINEPSFINDLTKQGAGTLKIGLEAILKNSTTELPQNFEDCVRWARFTYQELFHNNIAQLLFNFPPDAMDKSGAPFWSGAKRTPPKVLNFNENDDLSMDFVVAGANLRAQIYGILPPNKQIRDVDGIKKILSTFEVPQFKPKEGVKIQANENETVEQRDEEDEVDVLKKKLPAPASLKLQMSPISFEKDDDSNFHMQFIHAASNLRARNYSIDEVDRHKSKFIAGKITPAIATTTCAVTGLTSIEFYKILQDKKLDEYKNGFLNLALPLLAFSDPIAPKKFKYYDVEWTIWDRFDVKGDLTLKEFMDYFHTKHKLDIEGIAIPTTGKSLYMSYLKKETKETRMPMKMTELITTIGAVSLEGKSRVLVEILVEDEMGNDPDVPAVHLHFKE